MKIFWQHYCPEYVLVWREGTLPKNGEVMPTSALASIKRLFPEITVEKVEERA